MEFVFYKKFVLLVFVPVKVILYLIFIFVK